jgi:hypothetical protein
MGFNSGLKGLKADRTGLSKYRTELEKCPTWVWNNLQQRE